MLNSNVNCKVCGVGFHLKPSRIKKSKYGRFYCSMSCLSVDRKILFKGENNHQFGLKGDKNSSHKGDRITNQYGYVMLYVPNHPYADSNGRYREHRYVVEQNFNLFDESFFIVVNGSLVLDPSIDVHHKNEIKNDNSILNLMPMTESDHKRLHNSNYIICRNIENGRIIKQIRIK